MAGVCGSSFWKKILIDTSFPDDYAPLWSKTSSATINFNIRGGHWATEGFLQFDPASGRALLSFLSRF